MDFPSTLYRMTTALAATPLRGMAFVRPDLAERLALAIGTEDVAAGGVWLHAASVGEIASARVLAAALSRHLPVQVTTNTPTGRATARGWGLRARLAPLDLPGALDRFLDRVQPRVAVTVENEIWPNRAAALETRRVPRAVIGARMSARSAAGWARAPGLIGPVLGGLAGLSAQDAASEQRLITLGLPPDRLWPRLALKLLAPAAVVPPADSALRDMTVLAASTHEGEEKLILDAYIAARARVPGLRLIVAPRHPSRADAVAGVIAGRGLRIARRSAGQDAPAPVLLVDRLGEMARWYDAAGICLTGGSLVEKGGHTPWEPAAHRCAILHGPHVENAAESYAALAEFGATRRVDGATLASTLTLLAMRPELARAMGEAAREVLDAGAGDPAPLVDRILALAARGGGGP